MSRISCCQRKIQPPICIHHRTTVPSLLEIHPVLPIRPAQSRNTRIIPQVKPFTFSYSTPLFPTPSRGTISISSRCSTV
ncbi:unnamed protein product [Acanthoscelides obtectus]|uniref:Uncharacterized protein n=1 Tax=Acanthoscelides obtectus TaxID=200917 RepID=A0A9P0MGN2_ACAOB|nr:unnamed protein product [Acanthoscelides obtectus]CAK1659566.1 hypothetical protein AOBTE_LOCUS21542 [Acanthoscelides obtectus]